MEALFNSPAKKEYFTQLYINSVDESGKKYILILHTLEGMPTSESELRTYCDKVRVGETLKDSVERSLREDFNINQVIHFDYTGQVDYAKNRFGETLPRYSVNVKVPLVPLAKKQVIGLFADWIEWDPNASQELNEDEKKAFGKQEDEVMQKLAELGYFKFDPQEILEQDKATIREGLRESNFFPMGDYNFRETETIINGDKYVREDFVGGRAFPADEEDLFDGFISKTIKSMGRVLKLEGVEIKDMQEKIDDDDSHTLIINGKQYEIYNVNEGKDEYYYWGVAHKRLLEIINELLAEAGSKERLYGVGYGNDSYVIFLTDELYDYIKNISIIFDDQKPYSSEEKQLE